MIQIKYYHLAILPRGSMGSLISCGPITRLGMQGQEAEVVLVKATWAPWVLILVHRAQWKCHVVWGPSSGIWELCGVLGPQSHKAGLEGGSMGPQGNISPGDPSASTCPELIHDMQL